MAEFLQIPYADVVLAALVPGLLYYIALFVQADLEAAKLNAKPMNKADMPAKRKVLKGLYFLLPFAVLIIALFNFNQTPQMSALLAAVVVIALSSTIGYDGHRLKILDIFNAIRGAGMATLDIVMVCVAAGIVIGVLGISGLGFNLTFTLVQIGQGSLAMLLFLAAGVCIVLGMGLPTVGVYVLLATLVAPALVEVGIQPIAAHLYVMYFGMMSMITPPVAIAAFAAAGLAETDPMKTGWAAVQFGWMAYVVPFLFVLSPTLLLIGESGAIFLAVVTAIAGVWLVSIAIAGYFVRAVPVPLRFAFLAAGVLALMPAEAFPGAGITDLIGAAAGLALIAYEVILRRRQAALSNSI
jgi:TRAP transporter 4TM/12TM fusion protein